MIKLIVGLGNPGEKYMATRHNLGFLIVDELAKKYDITLKRKAWRYKAEMGRGNIGDHSITLQKPLTYMNLSGTAVNSAMVRMGVKAEELLVVHDDLDLDFGRIKIKWKGGDGGHKGIGSIIKELGRRDFVRLRLGINSSPADMETSEYVLQPFSAEETEMLPSLIATGMEAVEEVVCFGFERAMNIFNQKSR